MVGDIRDLNEVRDTLDICFDRPEKYIAEGQDPIVKFWKYRMFDHVAIWKVYLLLRFAIMASRGTDFLRKSVNEKTLPGILSHMFLANWKQWAKESIPDAGSGRGILAICRSEIERLTECGHSRPHREHNNNNNNRYISVPVNEQYREK
jgi:hypothetical protein